MSKKSAKLTLKLPKINKRDRRHGTITLVALDCLSFPSHRNVVRRIQDIPLCLSAPALTWASKPRELRGYKRNECNGKKRGRKRVKKKKEEKKERKIKKGKKRAERITTVGWGGNQEAERQSEKRRKRERERRANECRSSGGGGGVENHKSVKMFCNFEISRGRQFAPKRVTGTGNQWARPNRRRKSGLRFRRVTRVKNASRTCCPPYSVLLRAFKG